MNTIMRMAHRHVPSFRREGGGAYAVYVAVYSRIYRWHMERAHWAGRHGRIMPNGRCTWCGKATS